MGRFSSSTAIIAAVLVLAIVSAGASLGWSIFGGGIDSVEPGSLAFILLMVGGVAVGLLREIRTGDEAVGHRCVGFLAVD